MSLSEFWEKLTPAEKEKLRPYLEAELAELKKDLIRARLNALNSNRQARLDYILNKRRTLV